MLKDKKGVSLMIAYTLLIVIAIALSIAVSSYLTKFLPSQRAECSSDINLVIEKTICNNNTQELSITLSNRGLFNVPAMFVRLSEEDREVRPQVNPGDEIFPATFKPNDPNRNFLYDLAGKITVKDNTNYILEIQPAILAKRIIIPCENSIITDVIQCGPDGGGNECVPTGNPEICQTPGDEDGDCLEDCEDPDCKAFCGGECCISAQCNEAPEPGCNGISCGTCNPNEICNGGICKECIPEDPCQGKQCGLLIDNCGNEVWCDGNNGENPCGQGEFCNSKGQCELNDHYCSEDYNPLEPLFGSTCSGENQIAWESYCKVTCLGSKGCPIDEGDPPRELIGGDPTLYNVRCEIKIDSYRVEYKTGGCVDIGSHECEPPSQNHLNGVCSGDNEKDNNSGKAVCYSIGG